jgi:hypothetical protein
VSDPEIDAMGKVLSALTPLDETARSRVIKWAAEKLGMAAPQPDQKKSGAASSAEPQGGQPAAPSTFRDLADLFDTAGPETDVEKALVAGYWTQVAQSNPSFGSQSLNDDLKQLGHAIGNITRALDNLMAAKPALVQQLRKDGGTKQARKTYRLTAAGTRKVETMIRDASRRLAVEE